MAQPYYEQPYFEKEDPIPRPTFGQIMHEAFLRPFTWNARSTILTFWAGFAVLEVLTVIPVVMIITALVMPVGHDIVNWQVYYTASPWLWLYLLIPLALFIWFRLGILGLAARRLHDMGLSAYWLWLYLLAGPGQIALIIMLCMPTKQEPVRWGGYLFTPKEK